MSPICMQYIFRIVSTKRNAENIRWKNVQQFGLIRKTRVSLVTLTMMDAPLACRLLELDYYGHKVAIISGMQGFPFHHFLV